MTEMITVRPVPEKRAAFALWAVAQVPKVVTNSHDSFAVPVRLLTSVPEETLIGAVVDGHRYRSPLEDERVGVPESGSVFVPEPELVPGSWPGPEEVPVFAPLEDAPADEPEAPAADVPEAWNCDACGREFGTQRGLNKHRSSTHPEEKL